MISQRESGSYITHAVIDTEALAASMAHLLHNGDVVSFSGQLGAGKTVFIRGLAAGMGIDPEEISSPSYTLVNEYKGSLNLFHFDLYRLKDKSELYGIGWDDYLSRDGIVVAEWGEKAEDFLPKLHIKVKIDILSGKSRRITIHFRDF